MVLERMVLCLDVFLVKQANFRRNRVQLSVKIALKIHFHPSTASLLMLAFVMLGISNKTKNAQCVQKDSTL